MVRLDFMKGYKVVKEMIKNNRVVMIYGEPGVGKTSLVKEIGRELNIKVYFLNMNYLTKNDLVIMITDAEGSVDYKLPKYLKNIIMDENAILFLDEVNMNYEIQPILLEMILERKLFNYEIKCKLVLAGNDSYNELATELISPLKSRLFKIKLVNDFESFEQYIRNKYNERINDIVNMYLAFLEHYKNEVFMDNSKNINPRIHEFVIKDLIEIANIEPDIIISGYTDEIFTNRFLSFKEEILPILNKSIEDLIKDFKQLKISQKIYTINKIIENIKEMDKIIKYINDVYKKEEEMGILLLRKYIHANSKSESDKFNLTEKLMKKLPEIFRDIKNALPS